jgi:hypothetical protein
LYSHDPKKCELVLDDRAAERGAGLPARVVRLLEGVAARRARAARELGAVVVATSDLFW